MLFRYYFFKEGSRNYEVVDLLSYFKANPYISVIPKSEYTTVARYHNTILDFKADFILSNKSIVYGIERLNPAYIDTCLYVEFDVLSPTYDVELVINICEDICKMFNFYIYSDPFEDVCSFKKNLMIRAFEVVKRAYKQKEPKTVAEYHKAEPEVLTLVYDYLLQKNILEDLLEEDKINVPKIKFYAVEGKRKVYTSIDVSADVPFVFPTFVDMIHVLTSNGYIFISAEEFMQKTKKYFRHIESSTNNLKYVTSKEMKKIAKILTKYSFSPLILELQEVEFKKVLDI